MIHSMWTQAGIRAYFRPATLGSLTLQEVTGGDLEMGLEEEVALVHRPQSRLAEGGFLALLHPLCHIKHR